MDTIYKGATYELVVTSAAQLDTAQCNLFNLATRKRLQMTTTESMVTIVDEETGEERTAYQYDMSLGKAKTETAQVGVYDLELYAPDGSMYAYIKNFAKVVPSSKGQN